MTMVSVEVADGETSVDVEPKPTSPAWKWCVTKLHAGANSAILLALAMPWCRSSVVNAVSSIDVEVDATAIPGTAQIFTRSVFER